MNCTGNAAASFAVQSFMDGPPIRISERRAASAGFTSRSASTATESPPNSRRAMNDAISRSTGVACASRVPYTNSQRSPDASSARSIWSRLKRGF